MEATKVALETLVQDAHINRHPEIAPDTSGKRHVFVLSTNMLNNIADRKPIEIHLDDESDDEDPSDGPEAVPASHRERRAGGLLNGQPIPDLRFEQTYLASLRRTDLSWYSIFRVTLIDYLMFPMFQGLLWTLAVASLRHLRGTTTKSGRQFGQVLRDALNIGGVLD